MKTRLAGHAHNTGGYCFRTPRKRATIDAVTIEKFCKLYLRQTVLNRDNTAVFFQKWFEKRSGSMRLPLFDRKNDKYEQFNLVSDPYSLEQMEQLKSALKRKMAETNDSWDIQAKYPPEDYQNHADSNNWYEKLMSQAIFE